MSNPVEEYFKEHQNVCFSPKTIGIKLDIPRKEAIYYCLSSKHLLSVKPMDVGSLKYNMLLFKYSDVEKDTPEKNICDEYEII